MAASKKQENSDKLELKQQSKEDLKKQSAADRRKHTVTVEVDDSVHEALEGIRAEIESNYPGMAPSGAGLAKIAILRGAKAQ